MKASSSRVKDTFFETLIFDDLFCHPPTVPRC